MSKLEDQSTKIIQSSGQREKKLSKNKYPLSCIWDNIKWYTVLPVSQRDKRERRGQVKVFEEIMLNF